MNFANMTSAHFIFIPVVLFIGIVIGWILGSRAAQDAFAMEMKKRDARTLDSEPEPLALSLSRADPTVPSPVDTPARRQPGFQNLLLRCFNRIRHPIAA